MLVYQRVPPEFYAPHLPLSRNICCWSHRRIGRTSGLGGILCQLQRRSIVPLWLDRWKKDRNSGALGQPRFRYVSFVFFEDESDHLRNLETLSPGDTHQDLIGSFLCLAFQISWGRDFGTATSESEQCHVPWWHSGWHFRERAGWRHCAGILSESLSLWMFLFFWEGGSHTQSYWLFQISWFNAFPAEHYFSSGFTCV
jgi:hypothetical protein